MFEVQLKFYNREWKNYFGNKKYNKEEALELFEKLVESFSGSQWRLIYKPEEEIWEKLSLDVGM